MELKGVVLKAFTEERELVGKDGSKRKATIAHVVVSAGSGADLEICDIRAYDPAWPLPDVGKPWTSPRIRKYENFNGTIAEVSV